MKFIEILVPDSGPGGSRNRGDVVEVSDGEAKRLIESGRAKPHQVKKPTEKAVRSDQKETATR